MAHLRATTCVSEMEASAYYPPGVMLAQLSVITIHGEMITEYFIDSLIICEYCGEEVKPNGRIRSVRTLDPLFQNTHTRMIPDFNAYACCPPGMMRHEHSRGFCCCPTGLHRAYMEKGRGNPY